MLEEQTKGRVRISDVQIGISIYQQPFPWVKQAVESALQQNCDDRIICCIRIDGPSGCDIQTKEWLNDLSKTNACVKVIFGTTQLGTFGSYREIFEKEESEYLCQLDADDWLEPDAIHQCLSVLRNNPQSSFVYTNYNEVDKDGDFVRMGMRSEKDFDLNRQLVQFNTFHLRVIRRSHYRMAGGYEKNLKYTGDYDLSMKLTEQAKPVHISYVGYNYRLHGSNTSSRKNKETMQEAFSAASRALKRRGQEHLWVLNLIENHKKSASLMALTPRKGPIVIAGMHRSATSILALVLQKVGLNLGDNLIRPNEQNPDGYGEDSTIVEINRHVLQRTTLQGTRGWKDWGWANLQSAIPTKHSDNNWEDRINNYLKARENPKEFWGWKDPRNTLLLEDLIALEPNIKVIGIYRHPWEIIDALQRVIPPIFIKEPGWCLEIWNQYNSYLLSFAEKHPEQCIIINSSAFISNPLALVNIIQQKWFWPQCKLNEIQIKSITNLIRPNRHRSVNQNDPLIELHSTCSPRSLYLLERLNQIADLPSPIKAQELDLMKHKKIITHRHPEISIVITSFNQGDFLIDALASVERYRQIKDTEIIIVDDGSKDRRTCEVLSNLSAKGYKVIRQHNQGLPAARNTGIHHARGEFIIFLDDDNRLLSPYLNKGLNLIKEDPAVDVVYGDKINFGLKSQRIKIGQVNENQLWEMNRIDNCALIRKTYLERCGGYAPQLTGLGFEDWDLWLTGLNQPKRLKLKYLNEFCFEYRVRPNSMLQKLFQDKERQKQVMHILHQRHGRKVGHGGFRNR